MNFKLKLVIEKAKMANLPKENIEKAIKRGTGELGGSAIEQVIYEGFGPGGSAFIIECLTDNRNRSSHAIKHIFNEYGGNLGAPNSVLWQFENKGIIGVKQLDDGLELELIDMGVSDIEKENELSTLYCLPHDLEKIKKFLESKHIGMEFAEQEFVAKNKTAINDAATKEKIERFVQALEENDEVNNYYTNAEY